MDRHLAYHSYSIDSVPYSSHPTSFQVLKKIAKRGKTSTGYFYGFKLHLAINDKGEMLAYMLAPGNGETPVPVSDLPKNIFGKMFTDKR
ncbi:hypothetical protein NEOC84_000694|nr:hypothetical protein [Neochlamydia sp. AcF84]